MPKIVSESKFQEKKGLDRVSRIVHEEMKCLFQVISQDDYGIDGEIQVCRPLDTGTGYESTGKFIKVQVKSGKSYILNETKDSFSVKSRLEDLQYWKNSNLPIFFIVYNPNDDLVYCKDIKAYIQKHPEVLQAPYKVDFDKAKDQFGTETSKFIHSVIDIIPSKIDNSGKENLYSNLLSFSHIPELKSFRLNRDSFFFDEADFPLIVFRSGAFYTFLDIENYLAKKYSDLNFQEITVHTYENNRMLKNSVVVKLLYAHIRTHMKSLGLRHYDHFKRFYFPIDERYPSEMRRSWKNLMVQNPINAKRLVYKKYAYGRNEFYRHAAMSCYISFLGSDTFLTLNPEYFFTVDGEIPFEADQVGSLNTKIIAKKDNRNYFNDVCFWLDILNGQNRKDLLTIFSQNQIRLSLTPKLISGISYFRLLDDPVDFKESTEDPLQLIFQDF